MQSYHKKHANVQYINKNYVLKPIYNNENECINDMLSTNMDGSDSKTMSQRLCSSQRIMSFQIIMVLFFTSQKCDKANIMQPLWLRNMPLPISDEMIVCDH